MISWSSRRKIIISSWILFGAVIIIVIPGFFLFYEKSTCFDGKKNQNEIGVDCGGSCALLCQSNFLKPIVDWSRVFKVSDGIYNALTYLINPNVGAGVERFEYKFTLYDDKNVVIAERYGFSSLPPGRPTAVFEGNILTGEKIPVRTVFEITSALVWNKVESSAPDLKIASQEFTGGNGPRLKAVVENKSLVPIVNFEIIALLYDSNDNALASSRTIVDFLAPSSSKTVYFTWRFPIPSEVVRIEIKPKLYPGLQY